LCRSFPPRFLAISWEQVFATGLCFRSELGAEECGRDFSSGELKRWSIRSASVRMFLESMRLIDRSENACSAWRTLINGEHHCRCSSRRNTDLSPRRTPFAEKVPSSQNRVEGFLADFVDHGDLQPPSWVYITCFEESACAKMTAFPGCSTTFRDTPVESREDRTALTILGSTAARANNAALPGPCLCDPPQ
jgi:hypothetical protein